MFISVQPREVPCAAPPPVRSPLRLNNIHGQEIVRDHLDLEPTRFLQLPSFYVICHPPPYIFMDHLCEARSDCENFEKLLVFFLAREKEVTGVLRRCLGPKERRQVAKIYGGEERDVQQQPRAKAAY